jgi:phosphoethanolamine N-methyltransferase
LGENTTIHASGQYSPQSLRRYERIFGTDFLSSGGPDTTAAICATLGLRPGMRVLDVGSGLGGSAFYMHRVFGAEVVGIDLLGELVGQARARAAARGMHGVRFEQGDILHAQLPSSSFDLIYSRDAFLYVADKAALFSRLYHLLVPGGRLFISDYGCGSGDLDADFVSYARASGYHLHTCEAYEAHAAAAGFAEVMVEDKTREFLWILGQEAARIRAEPREGVDSLSEVDRAYLLERWEKKQQWCHRGDMKWLHLRARRAKGAMSDE